VKRAEVVGVELWGTAGREVGDYAYTVLYKFNGAIWRGREHARDELDAWRKFQARLDKEGANL
jgi:hypothetical protein